MEQSLEQIIPQIAGACSRMIISKPSRKMAPYRKIVVAKKGGYYQIEQYTEKQVFHQNVNMDALVQYLLEKMSVDYRQLNGFEEGYEHMLMISKKGVPVYKKKRNAQASGGVESHNRKKQYILQEGEVIPPLVDMGIFTSEGKVVRSMYDKFRQINRFIEIIDDAMEEQSKEELHVIDFGCGKSYLTFIMYYYFTQIRHLKVQMIGLDLKADVIEKCNQAAKKYGYTGLSFQVGDINGYQTPFDVDMVVTLHACDTATDFALFHAIQWNADMIFSVPCCQHELNGQMEAEHFALMTRYGIIKERFAALTTDAIRANLLECCGYKTQLLEFVDLSHTPKNLLIRAKRQNHCSKAHGQKMLREVEDMMAEYHLKPMLYGLLDVEDRLSCFR